MIFEGIDIKGKKVLVLGAGGASKPICVMLRNRGAVLVTVKNRTESKAALMCDDLNSKMNTNIFKVFKEPEKWDIIINTTSVGMGTDETPLDNEELLSGAEAAVDIIYHPRKTKFLETAERSGLKILNGLGMLVFQGVIAYEYFTGVEVSEKLCREVLELIDE